MPRVVDHAARRRALAEAALELVRSDGPEALSVRRVATATGWSSGALRHYVPDVDALAGLLLDEVSARVQGRVAAILSAGAPPQRRCDLVTVCLSQLLPLDDDRQVEFAVWRHFWGRDREGVEAAWVWTGQRMVHRQLVLLLAGRAEAEVPPLPGTLPPHWERWAAHLHGYVDGLALRVALAMPAPTTADTLADLRHFVELVADQVASGRN